VPPTKAALRCPSNSLPHGGERTRKTRVANCVETNVLEATSPRGDEGGGKCLADPCAKIFADSAINRRVRLRGCVNGSCQSESGTATINDDDSGVPTKGVTVSVKGSEEGYVKEGETAVFTVELSGKVPYDVRLEYSAIDGTAVSPGDYRKTKDEITIRAGETTAEVHVITVDDTDKEFTEKFSLEVWNIFGVPKLTAEETIWDDDSGAPPPGATISVVGSAGYEGHPAKFTVTMSPQVDRDVWLEYQTVDGTASKSQDYIEQFGDKRVTIPAGQTTASVQVTTLLDTVKELAETFELAVWNDYGVPRKTGQATLWDRDSGAPPPGVIFDIKGPQDSEV
jgi:hypothetical protein